MCGENPETRIDELLLKIDNAGEFEDDDGNIIEVSAQRIAEVIGTSPQVVGRLMLAFDDIWRREVRKGKVIYIPIKEVK
jgi:hypothetical protein